MAPDALSEQLRWLRADRRCAAAVLVEAEGSTPLAPGALLLVDTEGNVEGSLTGGCVESAVAQEALELLASGGPARLRTYGISDALAGTAGLTCGGTVHVLIQLLGAEAALALAAYLEASLEDRDAGFATALDGARAGGVLGLADDAVCGSLGAGATLDGEIARELRAVPGRSVVLSVATGSGPDVRVLVHRRPLSPHMMLVGANDFSAALAALAGPLRWRVTICDPRAAFVRSPRFAHAAAVSTDWPAEEIARRRLTAADAVVVLTHDPKFDVAAILAALHTDAGYVGALGSRRTTADRLHRLREAGADEAALARLCAPCGLDIGSATPVETAVSIFAELIAEQAGRSGTRLRDTAGSIRETRAGHS